MIIVDSHQHFWHPEQQGLPEPPKKYLPLHQPFLPSQLTADLDQVGIQHTVLVQGYPQTLANNDWLFQRARETPYVAGVVPWVDLLDPHSVGAQLETWNSEPKFVGIRHIVQEEPNDQFVLQENVLDSFRELARHDVPYDMVVYPKHLSSVLKVLEQIPELRMVIDHIGKPDIASGKTTEWAQKMAQIAKHPQAYCKFSGMCTEADWASWQPADLKPYAEQVLDWFGPQRVMYGSDWPVCLLATDYTRWWQTTAELLNDLSEAERKQVYGKTAVNFYRLSLQK